MPTYILCYLALCSWYHGVPWYRAGGEQQQHSNGSSCRESVWISNSILDDLTRNSRRLGFRSRPSSLGFLSIITLTYVSTRNLRRIDKKESLIWYFGLPAYSVPWSQPSLYICMFAHCLSLRQVCAPRHFHHERAHHGVRVYRLQIFTIMRTSFLHHKSTSSIHHRSHLREYAPCLNFPWLEYITAFDVPTPKSVW